MSPPGWARAPKRRICARPPGDITVNLEENSGFTAEYASVSGRFSSDFTGAGEKGRLLYGSGGPKLTLATTWGDMEIQRVTGVYAEMAGG